MLSEETSAIAADDPSRSPRGGRTRPSPESPGRQSRLHSREILVRSARLSPVLRESGQWPGCDVPAPASGGRRDRRSAQRRHRGGLPSQRPMHPRHGTSRGHLVREGHQRYGQSDGRAARLDSPDQRHGRPLHRDECPGRPRQGPPMAHAPARSAVPLLPGPLVHDERRRRARPRRRARSGPRCRGRGTKTPSLPRCACETARSTARPCVRPVRCWISMLMARAVEALLVVLVSLGDGLVLAVDPFSVGPGCTEWSRLCSATRPGLSGRLVGGGGWRRLTSPRGTGGPGRDGGPGVVAPLGEHADASRSAREAGFDRGRRG